MEDGNIDIPFCAMHIQQTHIAMHGKLTWCVGICVDAQMSRNQKHEEVDLGRTIGATMALVRAWRGVWKLIGLEGTRLIKYVADVIASPQ